MSRQAKIIIFSLILLFSIYQKQTNDNSTTYEPRVITKDTPKKKTTKTTPKKYKPKRKKPLLPLGDFKKTIEWFPTPKNGFSPYNQYFGKGIYNNNSGNEFIIKGDSLTAQLLDAELDVFEVSFNYDMCLEINTTNINHLSTC